jgi:hypothetical protein
LKITKAYLGIRGLAIAALKQLPDAPSALGAAGKVGGALGIGASAYSTYQDYQNGDVGGGISDGELTVGGTVGIFFPPNGIATAAGGLVRLTFDMGVQAYYDAKERAAQECQCKYLSELLPKDEALIQKDLANLSKKS